jgi:hypothetical protein
LKRAFVESYKLLYQNNSDVLDELLERMESVLSRNDFQKQLAKVENEIHAIEQKHILRYREKQPDYVIVLLKTILLSMVTKELVY